MTTETATKPTSVGKSFSSAGPSVAVKHSLDESDRQEAIAKAQAEARGEKSVELPEGVTPEVYAAMKKAGLLREDPAATPPATPEAKATEDAETPDSENGAESLEDLREEEAEQPNFMETIQAYSKEWFENEGTLSDDSREAVKKKHNLDDEALDFIMGRIEAGGKAAAAQDAASALQEMGYTVSDFQSWEKWSAANETPEDREARWEIMKSPNPLVRKQGVDALKAAYAASNKGEPGMIRGDMPSGSAESYDQILSRAMANPLFNKTGSKADAFRAEVDKQLMAAKRAGKGPTF